MNLILNIFSTSTTEAPLMRRMAISLRRCSASNITSPNTPIREIVIANTVNNNMIRDVFLSLPYSESRQLSKNMTSNSSFGTDGSISLSLVFIQSINVGMSAPGCVLI